jgi:hypothetical protein
MYVGEGGLQVEREREGDISPSKGETIDISYTRESDANGSGHITSVDELIEPTICTVDSKTLKRLMSKIAPQSLGSICLRRRP